MKCSPQANLLKQGQVVQLRQSQSSGGQPVFLQMPGGSGGAGVGSTSGAPTVQIVRSVAAAAHNQMAVPTAAASVIRSVQANSEAKR